MSNTDAFDTAMATVDKTIARVELKQAEIAKLDAARACPTAEHEKIKASPERWEKEVANKRLWKLNGDVLEIGECRTCLTGTIARPARR